MKTELFLYAFNEGDVNDLLAREDRSICIGRPKNIRLDESCAALVPKLQTPLEGHDEKLFVCTLTQKDVSDFVVRESYLVFIERACCILFGLVRSSSGGLLCLVSS
eukprot:GHVN01056239.1.p2 GENE.GHVN01056239.1~~GHVN01056239.1.p2  ORF type:complete len:106 (-),score=9.15 GHVN01056239.1:792-1109(-)